MNITTDEDGSLAKALADPLLDVPDGFTARVMAALPDRPLRQEVEPDASRVWRVLQAVVLAVCGTLGAIEIMVFVGGLWTATVVGLG